MKNKIKCYLIIFLCILNLTGCSKIYVNRFFGKKTESPTTTPPPVDENKILNGINIMDLGISGSVLPGTYGTNYTKPTLQSLTLLSSRGIKVVRIPFLWERLQPTLGGALDSTYLGYIMSVLRDADSAGLKVILDMHNYAEYTTGGIAYKFGSPSGPTVFQYQDVWNKLVNVIKADSAALNSIHALDIMNEPYGIPDMRPTFPDSSATLISNFNTTDEGWQADGGGTTLAYSPTHNGSIKVSKTTGSASYILISSLKLFMSGVVSTNGKSIKIKGHLPANVEGSFPRIRLTSYVAYSPTQLPVVEIEKGKDFEVYFNLSDAQWVGLNGLCIEVIINNVNGVGPYEYYIDEISQGTPIGGISPAETWELYSQGAVDAIRAAGFTKKIMVEGYNFASAREWSANHPVKWITDPLNKIVYQAHQYMDTERSGVYAHSFSDETTNAIGNGYSTVSERSIADFKVFTDWLEAEGADGYIGETGWPNSAMVPADAVAWNAVGNDVLTFLDSKNVGYTLWSTGSWLGPLDNILNIYDLRSGIVPLSQAQILEQHL